MNERVKKILLTRDTFMPEIHLGESSLFDKSGFLYSACVSFTKKQTSNTKI